MENKDLVNLAIDHTQINSDEIEKMDKRLRKRKFREDMNLNEALGLLVKEELIELMAFLGVYKSASKKKPEMCSIIETKIFERLPDTFGLMNYEHVAILNKPEAEYVSTDEIDNYLIENSLMFEYLEDKDLGLFVPVDVLEKINALADENENVLEVNHQIIVALNMVIEKYGAIDMNDCVDMLHTNIYDNMPKEDLDLLISLNYAYAANVRIDGDLFYHESLENAEEKDLHTKMYEMIQNQAKNDYTPVTPEDLGYYLEHHHLKNSGYSALKEFFIEFVDDHEESVAMTIGEINNMLSFGIDVEVFVQDLSDDFDLTEANVAEFKKLMIAYAHEVPQWAFKGKSLKETGMLKQQTDESGKVVPITKDKKIGRNDPCPCGSGKKYKKCCLNK